MTAAVASPRPRPASGLSVGASSAVMQIASAAYPHDPDALRAMALAMRDLWTRLDTELLHPQEPPHATASPR